MQRIITMDSYKTALAPNSVRSTTGDHLEFEIANKIYKMIKVEWLAKPALIRRKSKFCMLHGRLLLQNSFVESRNIVRDEKNATCFFTLSNPSNHVSRHLSWPDYLIRPERKKQLKTKQVTLNKDTYSTRWSATQKTSHDLKANASCDATRSAWTLAGLAREFRSLPQDVGSLLQGAEKMGT